MTVSHSSTRLRLARRLVGAVASGLLLASVGGVAAQNVQPVVRGEGGIPDAFWPSVYFQTFDGVVTSASLPPLRTRDLPVQEREVRVWIGGGFGYPQSLYRITEREGGVSGELVLYWPTGSDGSEEPGETFHDLMLHSYAGSCDGFGVSDDHGSCRALFTEEPDWQGVLDRAERSGLRWLPDSSELPDDGVVVFDGWSLTVELRDGPSYRAYHYGNPDAHPSWPEAARASEIASAFRAIRDLVRPPDVEKAYRGILSAESGPAFSLCGSDEVWELQIDLESAAEREGFVVPEAGPYGYVLELIAQPTPEWLARRWGSNFSRVVQVPIVVSVEPAHVPACE